VAESFFATLKREVEEIDSFDGWADANLSVGEHLDAFYSPTRRLGAQLHQPDQIRADAFGGQSSARKPSTKPGQP
jgi:hypothetical protein